MDPFNQFTTEEMKRRLLAHGLNGDLAGVDLNAVKAAVANSLTGAGGGFPGAPMANGMFPAAAAGAMPGGAGFGGAPMPANAVPTAGADGGMAVSMPSYGSLPGADLANRAGPAGLHRAAQRRRGGCPPGPMTCVADQFASTDGGYVVTEGRDFWGSATKKRTKWGRYNCHNEHGSCSFIGPGRGTNLFGVTETRTMSTGAGGGGPPGQWVLKQSRRPFKVDPRNPAHRRKYGEDFFEALEENRQSCPKCNER